MAKTFSSFLEASTHWKTRVKPAVRQQMRNSLKGLAQAVQKQASDSVGRYQQAYSPYPAWAPLKPSTIARKLRGKNGRSWGLNGNPDSPLYRTGKFQKSIFYRVNHQNLTATIGTTKEYIIRTELGTANMPPRPVFGPAALRIVPAYLWAIQANLVSGLIGTYAGGRTTAVLVVNSD